MTIQIETIETSALGARSHLVHDGESAVVIDPQRDVDRILEVAQRAGVNIRLVLETHIHNDYVTGGLDLAVQTGAEYAVAAAEPVEFDRRPVAPGDLLSVGGMAVRAMASSGHTLHHLAYVVEHEGRPRAVFTGGSLLYGTVGRTDLDHRITPDASTRAQFRGVRALIQALADDVSVHPTHGFGSFCSSAATSGASMSTIGEERTANIVFTVAGEDAFVETLLGGLTSYPRYYAHMGNRNRLGPEPVDLSPPSKIDVADLRRRIGAGEWVVDVRNRRLFADGHLAGTLGVEYGEFFTTYLGWVLTWGAPLTLVGSPAEIAEAQRAMARIGVDRLAGVATESMSTLAAGDSLRNYPTVDMAGVRDGFDETCETILDVRRADERRAGHIRGSFHVPLPELLERFGELPRQRLWVHCAGGFRASIAASMLDRSGFDVVLIDDTTESAERAGLPWVGSVPPTS